MKIHLLSILLGFAFTQAFADIDRGHLPADASKRFLFYLHGAIVEGSNGRPVSSEYGVYEYGKIIETLTSYGFTVYSEIRPAATSQEEYAEKIQRAIQTLLQEGVPEERISVVGASKGGVIAAFVSARLKNPQIRYVILAGFYPDLGIERDLRLHGRVFSIHDASDTTGRIVPEHYFDQSPELTDKKILITKTGLGHGLIFRPYPEWVMPAIKWLNAEFEKGPSEAPAPTTLFVTPAANAPVAPAAPAAHL